MRSARGDEPVDADRWLTLHQDQVVGARRAAAIDLVREAGLVPHVAHLLGQAPDPGIPDSGRIRLVIGDDGRVCGAKSG